MESGEPTMAISWYEIAKYNNQTEQKRECGVFQEARRKFHAKEMTVEQAIKWMESQPGWRPAPNCECETCKPQKRHIESQKGGTP